MVILVSPAVPVGGPAAQHAAKAELRRREYHVEPSLLSRISRWIGDRFDSAFDGAGGGSHALLLLAVVAALVGIVIALRVGVPTRRRRGRGAHGEPDPLAPVAAQDHRRLAMQYAADGRRAEALREWLRAAVQTIEQRGVLPPRPGRTGAATAREAGPALPAAAADLGAAMTAFDEVWFGGRPAHDEDVTRARAAADGVAAARITRITDGDVPSGLAVPG